MVAQSLTYFNVTYSVWAAWLPHVMGCVSLALRCLCWLRLILSGVATGTPGEGNNEGEPSDSV